MIKDTILVTATGFIHDVWRAQQVGRGAFKNLEALLIAAVIYKRCKIKGREASLSKYYS